MVDDGRTRRRASAITGVFQALRRTAVPAVNSDDERLQEEARQRLLRMCYLWPMLVIFGVFLPLVAYLQFRQDPEVALHARHGVVASGLYTAFALVLGLVHGVLGRIVTDGTHVSLACGLILLVLAGTLTALGVRWYRRALLGDPVEIPILTSLAERL